MAMNNNFHTLHNVWRSRKQTQREKNEIICAMSLFLSVFPDLYNIENIHEHKITHKAYLILYTFTPCKGL